MGVYVMCLDLIPCAREEAQSSCPINYLSSEHFNHKTFLWISSIKGQGTLRNDRGWSQYVTTQRELLLVASEICHEALDFPVSIEKLQSPSRYVVESTLTCNAYGKQAEV